MVSDLKVIVEIFEGKMREHRSVDQAVSQKVLDGLGESTRSHDQGNFIDFQILSKGGSWGQLDFPFCFDFHFKKKEGQKSLVMKKVEGISENERNEAYLI